MRIITLDSFRERALWTFYSWWAGHPVSLDIEEWVPDFVNGDARRTFLNVFRAWNFLRPFFASRGYTLYRSQPEPWIHHLRPDPAGPKAHPSPAYPFSRCAYTSDLQAEFAMPMTTVHAARDSEGRDVIIKWIVSGRTPTNELQILQALNTKKARADPRNHTIYVLDVIYFDGLAFVVMPRWPSAFGPDFGTVRELMHLTEVVLETFEFLHENRIAHCDFLEQNIGINVTNDWRCEYVQGVRSSSIVHYALYDFGYSLMYPLDTVLEDVRDDRFYNFGLRGLKAPTDPVVNPFQADIAYVGGTMERYLRVIEHIVPALGPFLDDLKRDDPGYSLTAHKALRKFREILSTLSQAQLNSEVTGRYWDDGVITTKVQRPSVNPLVSD